MMAGVCGQYHMMAGVWTVPNDGRCVDTEVAPASTEGRSQAHEKCQKGHGLRYFRYARNHVTLDCC